MDIGCGMIAVETDVPASRFAEMDFRRAFQEKLKTRIPVGEGVSHKATQSWDGFESYTANNGMRSDLWPSKLDRMNLGTDMPIDSLLILSVLRDGELTVQELAAVQGNGFRIPSTSWENCQ